MFGERLNTIRKLRGFTALKMSEVLGVGLRSYRMYESGDRYPSYEMLVKIADTLRVPTDFLLERDEYLRSIGVTFDVFL